MRKLIVALVLTGALASSAPAEAHGWRVRVGGPRVWVPGPHIGIRVWRPTAYWGWWRPYRTRIYYVHNYGYEGYAPCCAEAATPVPDAPPAPGPVAMYIEREPKVGLGIRASGTTFGENAPSAEGLGALLRYRVSQVQLELEVGHDRFVDLNRGDTRVGAALYVPLFGRTLQPYLMGGVGLNFVHVDGSPDRTQGFLAGGGGLALNFSRSFTLSADARYTVRHFFNNQDDVAPAGAVKTFITNPDDSREAGVEGRLSAIFYF